MSDSLVIGIDGGGTRSEGVVVDIEGQELARFSGGPLNYCTTSVDAFKAELTDLLGKARKSIANRTCMATVIGTAALFDRPTKKESQHVLAGIDLGGLGGVDLVGDALTAVYGATQGQPGILTIAGTGSIGIQLKADGRTEILGGLGPMLGGDPGSAYWMVSEAVRVAQQNQCRLGKLCPLGEKIIQCYGVASLPELVSDVHVAPSGRSRLAALAVDLAESGDENIANAWRCIEEKAGRSLATLLEPLSPEKPEPQSVFYSGSVLTDNPRVRESFQVALAKLWNCDVLLELPVTDAVMGAALMALAKATASTAGESVSGKSAL